MNRDSPPQPAARAAPSPSQDPVRDPGSTSDYTTTTTDVKLPPWLIDALPMLSGAELKLILAAMYDTARPGRRPDAPLPGCARLQQLTGLSRSAIKSARKSATDKGLLTTRGRRRDTIYLLCLDHFHRSNSDPHVCVWSKLLDRKQQQTLGQILTLGVAPPVALDMVRRYETDYLRRHIEYALEAEDAGVSWNVAGWLIASARDDRGRPLLRTNKRRTTAKPWYTEEEHDKYIKH